MSEKYKALLIYYELGWRGKESSEISRRSTASEGVFYFNQLIFYVFISIWKELSILLNVACRSVDDELVIQTCYTDKQSVRLNRSKYMDKN